MSLPIDDMFYLDVYLILDVVMIDVTIDCMVGCITDLSLCTRSYYK